VATDAFVSKDAMSAFLDPIDYVLAATRPEEVNPNAAQGFVDAELITNSAAVKHLQD
jgi:hypothetical protein